MNQATFFEQKSFSPSSMAMVIGVHAAFVTAAILWKVDIIRIVDPPIVVTPLPIDMDPPTEPQRRQTEPRPLQADVYIPPSPLPAPQRDPVFTDTRETLPPPDPRFDELPKPRPVDPVVQPARATGDVRALLSADDYPEAARRREETGTVQARLEIGTNGKVTGCSIVSSSGSTALDSATCKVLKARARFTPAKGSDGQPVSDSYVTPRIVWKIEGSG